MTGITERVEDNTYKWNVAETMGIWQICESTRR